jgi:hypothetical protein
MKAVVLFLALCGFASAFCQSISQTNSCKTSLQTSRSSKNRLYKTKNAFSRKETNLLAVVQSIGSSSSVSQMPITKAPHRLSIHQFIYVILTSIFVTCLVIADVIGVKIFEFKLPFPIFGHTSVEHTCGMITFPITFLLGDIINEYYGARATKDTIYIGLGMSILVFIVMNIAQALPYLAKPFNGKHTNSIFDYYS